MDVRYRLESITETEFRFNCDFDYQNLVPEHLKFQVGHEIKPMPDEELVTVRSKASLTYDKGVELATNTIVMNFGMSPLKEVIQIREDGTFETKDSRIFDAFIVAAIGTLRGVMMKNLKGTPLQPFFLPLIPMDNLRSH